MSANRQPRALFSAQSNLVLANQLADVFEAHRRLICFLPMRFRRRIDQLRGCHAARRRHLPAARLDNVVIDQRQNVVRLNPRAVAVNHSKAVRVAIRRQSHSRSRIQYRRTQWREIFFAHVRPRPVKQAIAVRAHCLHRDAVHRKRAIQVSCSASVQRVSHEFDFCLSQRFEPH